MQIPDVKELKKIVKFCRENGINHIKNGEFELSLSPAALFPDPKPIPAQDTNENLVEQTPSEEELLFWSSASPDEMSQ